MDVLILAAGLGSRLSNYTHDVIPKYLVNIDNNTGLFHIITYWNKYANKIYLVINSKYNVITQFYINNILIDFIDKIIIINYDTNDGTAYTLNYILNNDMYTFSNNLLLTWCDLFPKCSINFDKIKNNNIYVFTNGNKCRYALTDDNKIMHCPNSDGNIIGIYYFHNIKKFNLEESCKGEDIVSYLTNIGDIINFNIDNIIDYGDEDKLQNILLSNKLSDGNNKLCCRYFNNMEISNDNSKLLKRGINDKGKEIIINEIAWYEYLRGQSQNQYPYIPKIYDTYEYGFLMEYKEKHIPLYKFLNDCSENDKITVLNSIICNLNKLHNIEKRNESKISFFSNLKKEIYDKVYERKKIIDNFINYFGNITTVNSTVINTFDEVINKCKKIIIKFYETLEIYEYSIIFGDCQFSNILINPNDISDLIFIDPRGYFGNSKIFGPKEYDYAKVLYCISGYDNFNFDNFNIEKISNQSINFNIKAIKYDKKIINKHFNKVHKAFLVIIWLSFAEYTKNDIWKCLCAYYYGLYLGTIL